MCLGYNIYYNLHFLEIKCKSGKKVKMVKFHIKDPKVIKQEDDILL